MVHFVGQPKKQAEAITLLFDFSDQIPHGTTITSNQCVCEVDVFSGTDPTPTAILSGGPTVAKGISGGYNIVQQRVVNGVVGVIYKVTMFVSLSTTYIVERDCYLSITPEDAQVTPPAPSPPSVALRIIGSPPQGTVSVPYTFTWTAVGGTGTGYVFSVDSGSLPTSTSLTTNIYTHDTCSGTPSVAAVNDFVLRVTDSGANTTTNPETIIIGTTPPPPVLPLVGYISIANTNVCLLDTSYAVIASPAVTNPANIAVLPDRSLAYVACAGGNVVVIDAATYAVVNTISLGTVNDCSGIAIKHDGSTVYVSVSADGKIYVIDVATQTLTTSWALFSSPTVIVMHPTADKMYVVDTNAGTVPCVDTSGTLLGHYTTTYVPQGAGISPDGTTLYVGCYGDVEAFLTSGYASHTWQCNLRAGFGPNNVAVTLDGHKIYVSDYNYVSVSVVDTSSHLLLGYVNLGIASNDIKTNPDTGLIYVPAGTLQVINPTTDLVVQSINVGTSPKWLAFPP